MARYENNDILSQALLYDGRYDENWKGLSNLTGKEKRGLKNRNGWVRPLSRICEKVYIASSICWHSSTSYNFDFSKFLFLQTGIDGAFFIKNSNVELTEARDFVLFQRLTTPQVCFHPVSKFLVLHIKIISVLLRLSLFYIVRG